MKKKLFQYSATPALLAGMAALSPTASAQSPFDDVNFYVGATGGYMSGRAEHELNRNSGTSDSEVTTDNLGILSAIAGIDTRSNGWLFGVEGDIGLPLGDYPFDDDIMEELQWTDFKYNAHLRARVGRSVDNVDLFIAAGLAIAKFKSIDDDDESISSTLTGFSIGGGVDWAFNDLLKARVEILYDDYGDEQTFQTTFNEYTGDWSDVTVRGGLLFSF